MIECALIEDFVQTALSSHKEQSESAALRNTARNPFWLDLCFLTIHSEVQNALAGLFAAQMHELLEDKSFPGHLEVEFIEANSHYFIEGL